MLFHQHQLNTPSVEYSPFEADGLINGRDHDANPDEVLLRTVPYDEYKSLKSRSYLPLIQILVPSLLDALEGHQIQEKLQAHHN